MEGSETLSFGLEASEEAKDKLFIGRMVGCGRGMGLALALGCGGWVDGARGEGKRTGG